MRRFVLIALIVLTTIAMTGGGAEDYVNHKMFFFQENANISHAIFNEHFVLVYFDSNDMLCLVSTKSVYDTIVRSGRLPIMTVFINFPDRELYLSGIKKKRSITVYDSTLNLFVIVVCSKINYVRSIPGVTLIRMNGGFSIEIIVLNSLPSSIFYNRMACTLAIPESDLSKLNSALGIEKPKSHWRSN